MILVLNDTPSLQVPTATTHGLDGPAAAEAARFETAASVSTQNRLQIL